MNKNQGYSLIIFFLPAVLSFFLFGCAEKENVTYYLHPSVDMEMERHMAAAKEALDDFEIELAQESLVKGEKRLKYLVMARFSQSSIADYSSRLALFKQRLDKVIAAGVPVRVSFSMGYDPEAMEPVKDAVKIGNLRRNLVHIPYNRRVEITHLVLYYTKGPGRKQFKIYLKRLAGYRNHILRVFRARGLPEELICVAMIESAGDPTRVSSAGAAGLWQFMPETARKYGLMVNDKVDQRFDPILETYAAARYFNFLLKKFENQVPAALAGYNWGEGNVERLLSHPSMKSVWLAPYHGKTEEVDLPSMPKETYDYIVRWYAVAVIYQNLKEYDFEMPVTPQDPFILVYINGQLEVGLLARDLEISEQLLVGLNPSLKMGQTPGDETTAMRLPPAFPDDYAARLRKGGRYRISYVYRHKVTGYQTLRTVAQTYGVSALRIADVNDLGETNLLEAGTIIRIPTTAGNEKAKAAARENVGFWRARKGTLWDKESK